MTWPTGDVAAATHDALAGMQRSPASIRSAGLVLGRRTDRSYSVSTNTWV